MYGLQETIWQSLVRYLVQRDITCRLTGKVLDMDTCVVFVDADGDPAQVYHESVRPALIPEILASLEAKGYRLGN